MIERSKAPPPGARHYRIYCPECERFGIMAGMRYVFTGKDVPPEEFRCPECGEKLEVLGRDDQ